jgi:hypothetical protein
MGGRFFVVWAGEGDNPAGLSPNNLDADSGSEEQNFVFEPLT